MDLNDLDQHLDQEHSSDLERRHDPDDDERARNPLLAMPYGKLTVFGSLIGLLVYVVNWHHSPPVVAAAVRQPPAQSMADRADHHPGLRDLWCRAVDVPE